VTSANIETVHSPWHQLLNTMKYLTVKINFKPHNHYISVIIIQTNFVSKNYGENFCISSAFVTVKRNVIFSANV